MAHPSCWIPPSLAPLCRVSRQQRLPAQRSTRFSSSRNNCSSKNNRHWQLHHRYWCLFVIWIHIINLIYCPRLLNFEAGVAHRPFFFIDLSVSDGEEMYSDTSNISSYCFPPCSFCGCHSHTASHCGKLNRHILWWQQQRARTAIVFTFRTMEAVWLLQSLQPC